MSTCLYFSLKNLRLMNAGMHGIGQHSQNIVPLLQKRIRPVADCLRLHKINLVSLRLKIFCKKFYESFDSTDFEGLGNKGYAHSQL